ncbi:recombinase family protein [Clostridium sp. WILCCON 0269]|uniref:Recombinase family protein n=1 Tax=Candidatus Clostridium eludens TaxID=3381663 RepID=A0ABW8SML5_9CLOT
MNVCIYLRKSRADEELERDLGQGETLAKHRKALLKYAKEKDLNIVEVHEEIVSGESLIHRPEMLKMLKEIENGRYDAVLCMDVQRLGRGNMQEQGLILQTFKDHNTKIITLQKTYDLNNDFDEEYSEFEAFMSRKELKMINRRLQSGRIRSIEEGNYLSPLPPYGYNIKDEKHSRSLSPHTEQSPVVKLIFDMYVSKHMGCGSIASELDKMGYKSYTGSSWSASTIASIIKNPVYIGKVTWKKKDIKKSKNPNKVKDTKLRPRDEWVVVDGKHPSIIDENTFYTAQEIINRRYHVPYQITNGSRNPLAGIIICGICGSKMVYRPYGNRAAHIICPKKNCSNKSSKFIYIENRLLESMKVLLENLELNIEVNKKENKNINMYSKQIKNLESELNELKIQKTKLYDLLERGIYDIDTFVARSKNIADRIEKTTKSISILKENIIYENKKQDNKEIIFKIKNVLQVYEKSDINKKNILLKNTLVKAIYLKRKDQKDDDFSLVIYPRISF